MTSDVIVKLVDGHTSDSILAGIGNESAFVRHVKALFPNAPTGAPTRSLFVAQVESVTPQALKRFIKDLSSMQLVEYAELPAKRDLLSRKTLA